MHRLSDELQTILQQGQYLLHIPFTCNSWKNKAQAEEEEGFFLNIGFPELPDCTPVLDFAYLVHFSLMVLSALLLLN